MTDEFRKLVTIRKVDNILPIENADLIELIKIDGWQCISKKGEFKIGDYCVYFEIDSFLPINQKFEFLRKSCYKKYQTDGELKEGFRLKTIKLKGQLSQGLALPVSILTDDIVAKLEELHDKNVDITENLGVIKYDPPLPSELLDTVKSRFPSFLRKTDQERIQNFWKYKDKYSDLNFEVSLKLNGTSFTAFLKDGEFGVCSRNLELKVELNRFSNILKKYDIENKLKFLGLNIAIQGEVIGERIQGNYECVEGESLYIFDVFDIDTGSYLTPDERIVILNKLDLNMIKILDYKKFSDFNTLDEILEYAEGPSLNSNVEREGVVFKSTDYFNYEIISFKVISNKFLLNEK